VSLGLRVKGGEMFRPFACSSASRVGLLGFFVTGNLNPQPISWCILAVNFLSYLTCGVSSPK